MDCCVIFLSLFILLLKTKFASAQLLSNLIINKEGLFFDASPDHRMNTSIYTEDIQQRTVQVPDKMKCIFTCIGISWCLSVNFNIIQRNGLYSCELLSVDRYSHLKDFLEDNSYIHFSVKNPCEEKICFNGGTCVPQYDRLHSRCVCRQQNSGEWCEKVLYLDVSIRSVGLDDKRVNASCNESMIRINNIEKCLEKRGHNIVAYNKFGVFQNMSSFDTHENNKSGHQMKTFLEELPNENIVLIAVYDSGSHYFWDALPALRSVGAVNASSVSQFRSSWLLVGYKGGSPSWITEQRADRYKGPSTSNVKIPIPVNIP